MNCKKQRLQDSRRLSILASSADGLKRNLCPARVATALKENIWLSPHKKGHKYERFMEEWGLFRDCRGL
jgi:hypothetical protein